jgi:hypothetical protein
MKATDEELDDWLSSTRTAVGLPAFHVEDDDVCRQTVTWLRDPMSTTLGSGAERSPRRAIAPGAAWSGGDDRGADPRDHSRTPQPQSA